jgi:methyl-accepting chemotaxis protein
MTRALEVFRQNAADRNRMRVEAERERVRMDEQRKRSEEETIARERQMVRDTLGRALRSLAERDLSYRLSDDLPEAYHALKTDFNDAMVSLSQSIERVLEASQHLKVGAERINIDASSLTRRTEEQVDNLTLSDSSLRDLGGGMNDAVTAARVAQEIVTSARGDAEASGGIVRQAINAMADIQKSADEIGRIISVIDEIAFQTNLLALNAGVEAARAGEAGRGFAVVASEVRALAQRSADAAKEIKSLIDSSRAKVKDGVVLVGGTGEALERIVDKVGQMTARVATITELANAQSVSVGQVQAAMRQIGSAAEDNAGMAEKTSAAGQTLLGDAEALADEMSRFRLDTTPARGRERSRLGSRRAA